MRIKLGEPQLLVLCFLVFLSGLYFIAREFYKYPLNWDEGLHGNINLFLVDLIKRVLSHGLIGIYDWVYRYAIGYSVIYYLIITAPLPHLLGAASVFLLGRTKFALVFPQLLFTILTALLIYFFSREYYHNKNLGLLATFIFLTSPLVLIQAFSIYMDPIAPFFYLLACFFLSRYVKHSNSTDAFLTGLSIALGGLSKQPVLLVALPVLYIMIKKPRTHIGWFLVPFSLVFFWYVMDVYAAEISGLGVKDTLVFYGTSTTSLSETFSVLRLSGWFPYFFYVLNPLVAILVFAGFFMHILKKDYDPIFLFALFYILLANFVFASFFTPRPQISGPLVATRYILPAVPLLAIIAARLLMELDKLKATVVLLVILISFIPQLLYLTSIQRARLYSFEPVLHEIRFPANIMVAEDIVNAFENEVLLKDTELRSFVKHDDIKILGYPQFCRFDYYIERMQDDPLTGPRNTIPQELQDAVISNKEIGGLMIYYLNSSRTCRSPS